MRAGLPARQDGSARTLETCQLELMEAAVICKSQKTNTHTIMANMFGALNRFISRLDADPQAQKQRGPAGAYGFQVLRNNNPELPLEPWFDSIIGINGRTIVCPYSYSR